MPQNDDKSSRQTLIAWIKRLILPRRASTQTWMFLTFATFVGLAVAGVGLYVFFVLGSQVKDVARATHISEVEIIARAIEREGTAEEREHMLRVLGDLTELYISVAQNGTIIWETATGDDIGKVVKSHMSSAKILGLQPGETFFESERIPGGKRVTFAAVSRSESGYTVGVGQPEKPLHSMTRSMGMLLVLGMVMALLMALVGSWVASEKVTKPLLAIGKTAANISGGDTDTIIDVETRSAEIQDLADNLELMSKSFREKIETLQRLTRLQNDFIGNVSHEVRNPIFAVSGYLEALDSPLNAELRQRYVKKGLANLERLGNLFNHLIEIAQLEYREDLIQPKSFDIVALMNEVSEILKPKAQEKGISLVMEGETALIYADRNRIQQVLVNLIDNAIAYSDHGTVRCRSHRHLDKVSIVISDHGRGIGKKHLRDIFERFYRVDPDRSRKSGGTGLGLSIVRQILHAHGESIHVESVLGSGSRFWFELPVADPEHTIKTTA